MYDTGKRQFLLKQSDGKLFNFYHSGKTGVAAELLLASGQWGEPALIYKTSDESFHAALDANDRFHVLAGSDSGGLTYIRYSGGQTAIVPILESRSQNIYDKFPTIVPAGDQTHFFYVLKHGSSCILSHQVFSATSGMAENPRVIDFVSPGVRPYRILPLKPRGLLAIYISPNPEENGKLRLMQRKFTPGSGNWSESEVLDPANIWRSTPSAITTAGDDFTRLCYQKKTGDDYSLVFKNDASDPKLIHRSSMPFDQFGIVQIKRALVIFWVRDDNIYYSSSDDMGENWSKYTKYIFADGRPFQCFGYMSNQASDPGPVVAPEVPGITRPAARIAFYSSVAPSPQARQQQAQSADNDLKSMIIETLDLCRTEISDLRASLAELNDAVISLRYKHDEREKQLGKLQIMVAELMRGRSSGGGQNIGGFDDE